jgi:transcription factor S
MFCEKCGKLLKNQGGSFVCTSCGIEKTINDESLMQHVDKRKEKEIVIVEDTEIIQTLPTIEVKCPNPKCGNGLAFWWLRQLRAADESEVRFFRCTKCGKTWREYD